MALRRSSSAACPSVWFVRNWRPRILSRSCKHSEGSLLRQYEREFAAYGIQAKFEDSAIERIAERAEAENTGARAL